MEINNNNASAYRIPGSKICVFVAFMLPWNVWSSFYQSGTLANYCKEYVKMIRLEKPVNQLEAGICAGYTASKIEVMDLSGQICDRKNVNLDHVVEAYIERVELNDSLSKKSATFVMVDLLERKYACKNEN